MSVKFIPWLLAAQQEHCLSVISELLECAEADTNSFKNTITGDETWAYSYRPKTK
jgi:hypothetical protein